MLHDAEAKACAKHTVWSGQAAKHLVFFVLTLFGVLETDIPRGSGAHPRVYNRGLVLARLQMELLGTGPLRAPWHDCMLGPGQRVTAAWLYQLDNISQRTMCASNTYIDVSIDVICDRWI